MLWRLWDNIQKEALIILVVQDDIIIKGDNFKHKDKNTVSQPNISLVMSDNI